MEILERIPRLRRVTGSDAEPEIGAAMGIRVAVVVDVDLRELDQQLPPQGVELVAPDLPVANRIDHHQREDVMVARCQRQEVHGVGEPDRGWACQATGGIDQAGNTVGIEGWWCAAGPGQRDGGWHVGPDHMPVPGTSGVLVFFDDELACFRPPQYGDDDEIGALDRIRRERPLARGEYPGAVCLPGGERDWVFAGIIGLVATPGAEVDIDLRPGRSRDDLPQFLDGVLVVPDLCGAGRFRRCGDIVDDDRIH